MSTDWNAHSRECGGLLDLLFHSNVLECYPQSILWTTITFYSFEKHNAFEFMTLRISAGDLERVLFAIEHVVETGSNSEGEFSAVISRRSRGIPKALCQEFIRATRILVTPSRPSIGKFVVITGVDKAGKETQAFNPENRPGILSVYDYLIGKSFRVLKLALPSYNTVFGSLIASYLGKNNSLIVIVGNLSKDIAWVLWSIDRTQHNTRVQKWLGGNAKNIVLSKRWTETNIAYQKSLGIDEKRILKFERNIAKADYTIVLDVPVKFVFGRMKTSGEIPDRYETPEFLSKVSDTYANLELFYPYGKIFHVDGSGSFEEVNKRILKTLSNIKLDYPVQMVSQEPC